RVLWFVLFVPHFSRMLGVSKETTDGRCEEERDPDAGAAQRHRRQDVRAEMGARGDGRERVLPLPIAAPARPGTSEDDADPPRARPAPGRLLVGREPQALAEQS